MGDKRNNYYEFLRGLAIIMVVGIHSFRPPQCGLFGESATMADWINVLVRQLIQSPVPIFLAISGFFIGQKALSKPDGIKVFWRRQIPKVYIPCLVWSIPWLLMSLPSLSTPADICRSVLFFFLCGFSVYYFILLIIQCYVLSPLLQRVRPAAALSVTFGAYIVHIVLVTYIRLAYHIDLPLIIYAAPFTFFGFYFVLGMTLGKSPRDYPLAWPVIGIIAGTILQMYESCHWGGYGVKLSSIVYCTSVILLLFSDRLEERYNRCENLIGRTVRHCGEVSFGIYLIHTYFLFVIRHFGIPLGFYLTWLTALLLSVAVVTIGKRLLPRYAEKYLGFR